MALIKKLDVYPPRIPKRYDYVPGTSVDENGKTVSFRAEDIANLSFGISENMVFFISPITVLDNTLTVNNSETSVSQWRINNIEFLSSEIFTQNIPFTFADGFIRTDLLVVTNDPEQPFKYILGAENAIYSPSPLPGEGELRITEVFVDNETITVPPFDLTGYVTKKSYKIYDTAIIDSGDYISSIKVNSETRSFNILKPNSLGLKGFSVDDTDIDNFAYDGMPIYIRNGSEENIELIHNEGNDFLKPFLFSDNQNMIMLPGETYQFLYGTKFIYYVGKFYNESSVEINQNNVPKKVTFSFFELGLENTATHEEIIEALKVYNTGLVISETDLLYIEVVQEDYNFDIELTGLFNWEQLYNVVDQTTFEEEFLQFTCFFETYTVTDFEIIDKRIRCNIANISGSNTTIELQTASRPTIVHNLNLKGVKSIILSSNNLTIHNIRFNEGLLGIIIGGWSNIEVFDKNIPSTVGSVIVSDSPTLKKFISQLPSSLFSFSIDENQMTLDDYESMEDWASNLPVFDSDSGPSVFNFSNNIDSITGTNLETILLTKNVTIIP